MLERGAVVGQVFPTGAVAAMSSDPMRSGIGTVLDALQRRRLIRPDDASLLDDTAFAFVHLLVRDAAYSSMLRRLRAELHERFADWLLVRVGDRLPEFEEIVGYHLERAAPQSHRARSPRRAHDQPQDPGRRSPHRERAEGLRDERHARGRVAVRRANDLLLEDDPRLGDALLSQAIALMEAGGFDRSRSVFERAENGRPLGADDRTLALVRLGRIRLSLMDETTVGASDLRIEAERAVQISCRSTTILASHERSTRSGRWSGSRGITRTRKRHSGGRCFMPNAPARSERSGQPRLGNRGRLCRPDRCGYGVGEVRGRDRACGWRPPHPGVHEALRRRAPGDAGGIREGP